eukprot:TRINITY_DN20580_c0_g1_i2.p1 TRINITY_DN20580_c0_g1~~TRINITY_DN20580_c0_g1_i2.p1  ORF type:complete len:223 (-),score=34.92 TRINITY_DN20580_c0_g1_i2:13-627(-)
MASSVAMHLSRRLVPAWRSTAAACVTATPQPAVHRGGMLSRCLPSLSTGEFSERSAGRCTSFASGGLLRASALRLAAEPVGMLRWSPARFAPKKAAKGKAGGDAKGAAAAGGPAGATQLFNIYAERKDEELRAADTYPKWLWELHDDPPKGYGELAMMFIHGVNIEEARKADYQRFLRLHRKLVIKLNNLRLKKKKKRSPSLRL